MCGVGAAGVAVAGAAGLFVDVRESWERLRLLVVGVFIVQPRTSSCPALTQICARRRAELSGHAVSVFVRDE